MDLKISPRNKNDRGGVACMPLRRNVPEGREGWKLTTCPNCGRECWEMPLLDVVKAQGASALCTECALKQGAEKTIEKNIGAYAVYLAKKENIVNMKSKCGSMKELNRDLQEFFVKCGVTDEDVAVVKKNGEEYIVIEETVGQNIMHIITEKMTAQGHMTYAVAEDYLKNGSDPLGKVDVKTNADRIRSMTDEELADWLSNMRCFEKDDEPYKSIYNIDRNEEEEIYDSYGDLPKWLREEA